MDMFDQYAEWTDNVAVYPKIHEPHYLALGLMEEMGEMYTAATPDDIVKEAGDVLWYAARYSRLVLKIPFSTIVQASPTMVNLTVMEALAVIAGVEKKRLRDGETWDEAKTLLKHAAATEALSVVVEGALRHARQRAGASPLLVVKTNCDKLSARKETGTIRGDGDQR